MYIVIAIMHLILDIFIIKCFIFHNNLCCGIVGIVMEWVQNRLPLFQLRLIYLK